MRLTTVILIASLMQVSATGLAQKISLSKTKAPLGAVLLDIKAQSGYDFIVSEKLLSKAKPVTIKVSNTEVTDVLEEVFENQNLAYEIDSKTVLIKEKELSIIDKIVARFQEITVTGKVVDEDGRALGGASVTIKATGKGTSTKADGTFAMSGVEEGATLLVKFLGYEPLEITAAKSLGVVQLKQSENALDQVVIRAYDQTSQRLSTGNITTVSAKQLENKPVTNPLLALQGLVPGLNISQASGWSKSGVTVQIQGPNSLANGNTPFYVVDGVPYPSQALPLPPVNDIGNVIGSSGNGAMGGGEPGNPLNFLNPQDIESISVLKDADATAIYGSQAANGAIIITTKKAKAGTSNVSVSIDQGFSKDPKFLKVMGREEYLQMRHDAYFGADKLTRSSPQYANQYDLNGVWDNTRETDWQAFFLGGTAKYTNVRGSISGGSAVNQYLLSATYNRQTTILPIDLSDQSGSMLINLNHTSPNEKFKTQFSGTYSYNVNRLPSYDPSKTAYSLSPVAPALYNADGTFNWQPDASGRSSWTNPMAAFGSKTNIKVNNLISNLVLSYQFFKNLQISSSFGYTDQQQDLSVLYPTSGFSPEQLVRGDLPFAIFSNGSTSSWIIEPRLNFTEALFNGRFHGFLAATVRRNNLNSKSFRGENYSSDLLLNDISAAGQITNPTSDISQYRYAALFGHLGYTWQDKYILNMDLRRDGSSRFGSNNKFHNFWSTSAGWIFSDEKLIERNIPLLSFGKLYASYGTTGSDGIGDYSYLSSYLPTGVTYQGLASYTGGLSNANVQWEETRKLNLGLSLGFFKDRILITGNLYRNRSSNQLLIYGLPGTTGFGGVTMNLPATVQNAGWEMVINAKPVITSNFQWNSNFNIGSNRNKLLKFPNIEESSYSTALIGQPLDLTYIANFGGLNSQTGLYQFYKADGSLAKWSQIHNPADYVAVSRFPKFSGGWNNSFSYKAFSLDVTMHYVKQVKQDLTSFGIGATPGSMANQLTGFQYWKQAGDNAPAQRLTAINNFDTFLSYLYVTNFSNAAFKDASYVRLENIVLTYKLPSKLLTKIGVRNTVLSYNVQNALTITGYEGLDPETGFTGLPPLRTMTLGIKADF